jgi:hypothetical protein
LAAGGTEECELWTRRIEGQSWKNDLKSPFLGLPCVCIW